MQKDKHFINSQNKYYLGLDLGISSVGWAVMVKDQVENHFLHDFGVRIFYPAEDKDKKSDAQKRRRFRSQRRLIRRRFYRIKKIKKILEENNFLTKEQFKKDFNLKSTNKVIKQDGKFITEKGYWNPFIARNKGLKEKLEKTEIYAILIHFCKKRGYLDKFSMENEKESKNKSEFKSIIKKTDELIAKHTYISKVILNESKFQIKKDNQILIYAKNDEDNYKHLFSRKAYETELKVILEKQSIYYEKIKKLKGELIETVFQQRDFEDGAKCKDHEKNKENNMKCNPNICSKKYGTFMDMVGNCPFYPKEKRGYKSSITF